MAINVKILEKETIKPSSPTPLHLRNLTLSFNDQFEPDIYVPLLLFYPKKLGFMILLITILCFLRDPTF